ncbi:hypothetical protein Dimus_007347 [Dionaea muscipula]
MDRNHGKALYRHGVRKPGGPTLSNVRDGAKQLKRARRGDEEWHIVRRKYGSKNTAETSKSGQTALKLRVDLLGSEVIRDSPDGMRDGSGREGNEVTTDHDPGA